MALVSEYDGYIFDFGGVLVHHQTEEDQARLAHVAGISKDVFSELYWSTRLDYDKGILGGTEYWEGIATGANTFFTPEIVEELIGIDAVTWMRFDDVMWAWLEQLRSAGKRVAMLSNMPSDLGLALKAQTDRLSKFDQVTLSYEVHSVKPEPAIYEHCLEGLGTAPNRTIFFDDRIANVQGAEMLGIRAIEFLNRDDVLLKMTV